MSGKSRSKTEFDRIKVQFFENGNQKGYREEEVSEVWRQIESFAGYAFAKGHSASYAVESYQSLFLRAYYPLEYLTAVINNGGGFYGIEFYLKEAVRLGARVYTPCINKSHIQHTIVKDELYLGFIALKELEERSIIKIVEARTRGEFKSLFDFIDRVPIGNSQIELLIRAGAFSFTNENKHSLLWQALGLKNSKQRNFQPKLFASEQKGVSLTHLKESAIERTYELWELLGFPLSMTFELLKNPIQGVTADQLEHYDRKAVRILGYLVTVKNTRTKNGKIMQFATYLDINGAIFDTTSFPEIAQKYPVLSKGIYLIEGLVYTEFGFRSIEVKRKERCEYVTNTSF
jgi:DNA polymerase III alpha subunit